MIAMYLALVVILHTILDGLWAACILLTGPLTINHELWSWVTNFTLQQHTAVNTQDGFGFEYCKTRKFHLPLIFAISTDEGNL